MAGAPNDLPDGRSPLRKEPEMTRLRRDDRGFTLIELMIVVATASGAAWVVQTLTSLP
jgi:prepilin-type N-terminal cleavage/methylation domain-containing protein